MAAFFPPHVPPEHAARQPIKLSGFAVPSTSSIATPPTLHHSNASAPGTGHSAIDPAILFGLAGASASNSGGWNGFTSGALSQGGGGGSSHFGSSSVLTETDLDIENMLASFSQHHHAANGTGPTAHGGIPNGGHHFFGSAGTTTNPTAAGSNGFLGTTSMGYGDQQQQQVRHGSISTQGQTSPHFFGINSAAQDQAHPPSSVAAIPHFANSPPLSSSALSSADFFPSITSRDSPLAAGSADPSSRASDTFSAPASKQSPAAPTSRGREGRSQSRGGSGSTERAGSRSRSTAVSTGVGKAPRTTSRSRSARRNSTAAGYQDRPSPNERSNSNAGTPSNPPTSSSTPSGSTATPNSSASHGSAAIIIPSSTPAVPLPSPSHQYSASVPAYPSATPSSLPSSLNSAGWFSHTGLSFLPSFPTPPLKSVPEKTAPDPVTGWRPSHGIVMPASAPPATTLAGGLSKPANSAPGKGPKADPAGSSTKGKKSQAQQSLEDVQEEEGDERPTNNSKADPAEKRRKRRESHNLVERRRRDNINDRIAELSALLPEHFVNANGGPSSGPPRRSSSSSGGGNGPDAPGESGASPPGVSALSLVSPAPVGLALFGTSPVGASGASLMAAANPGANSAAAGKPNKGIVLAKSVEYIRYLLDNIELQTQQIAELQRQNQELRSNGGVSHPATLSADFDLAHHHQYLQHQHHQQQPSHFHVTARPPHERSAQSGEWAAFEDEDVGDDVQYKREEGDDDDDDEGMDES
ncbi:hypothetical protein JCM11491_001979 [Sporobolomyces phaffii]